MFLIIIFWFKQRLLSWINMNSVDDQNEMDIDNATKDVLRQVYEK